MAGYIFVNIKRNKDKFVFLFIVITLCETFVAFSLQVINNINYVIRYSNADKVLATDMSNTKYMLEMAAVIFIGLSLTVVYSNYSVFLQRRQSELKILYNLGYSKSRIKGMLLLEVIVLELVGLFFAGTIGSVGAGYFVKHYAELSYSNYGLRCCLIILLGSIVIAYLIIQKALGTIVISWSDSVKHHDWYTKKDISNKRTSFIICGIIVVICLIDFNQMFEKMFDSNGFLVKSIVFWTCILVGLDGAVFFILQIINTIAKKKKIMSLYVAVEQNLFKMKKVMNIITCLFIAVVLQVGLLGFYSSIRASVEKKVNESYHYDYLVKLKDRGTYKLADLETMLKRDKGEEQNYSVALTKELFLNGKRFIVIGVDESYCMICDLQKLILQPGAEDASKDSLPVVLPQKKVRDHGWKIGDSLEIKRDDMKSSAVITNSYAASDLNMAFTNREQLSTLEYAKADEWNTIYFQNYDLKEIRNIMSSCGESEYTIDNKQKLVDKSVSQSVNGTEIFEAYIYLFLFYSVSLIINLFIISNQERVQDYRKLILCGVKRRTILNSMLIEGITVYVVGVMLGWLCGDSFIDGALILMKKDIIIDTIKVVPYRTIGGVILLSFLLLIISILVLSKVTIQNCSKNINNWD